jgi:RNase P subunit RPR2
MEAWIKSSEINVFSDMTIARKQAEFASIIQKKARLKKPYELNLLFCKKCKRFSPPAVSSSIRLRNGMLVINCRLCGKIYRRPFIRTRNKL